MSVAEHHRRPIPLSGSLCAGIMLSLLSAPTWAQQALSDVQREVPVFELADTTGKTWTEDALQGKPWIINFWATWCPPCVEEMPSMNRAWQSLEAQDIGMLAINAGEGELAVAEFLEKVNIDFPVLMGDAADTLAKWSVQALPTTVLIDAKGRIVYEALGPREWDDPALLEQVLELR